MKKICFVEMEGVLLSHNQYKANERRACNFISELSSFCAGKKIGLYMVTGFHEPVAHKKFESSCLVDFFDDAHFLHVDKEYIDGKLETDRKIHLDGLAKDPEFNDSYFKQVVMEKVLTEHKISPRRALLLCDDLWVDGYYTMRFSKVDFAIFEENILDRGKPAEHISGLAYFSLGFPSVKMLLENFPQVDLKALDKLVFESMKKALIDEDAFSKIVKNKVLQKKP